MEIKFTAKREDLNFEETFTLEDIANLRDTFYAYTNWRAFTGKTDINGKEVYVGDKTKDGGVIECYQDTCQFVIKLPCVEVQELKDCEKWLEVVGTIHDKN